MESDIKIAIINEEKIDYMFIGKEDIGHATLLNNYIKNKYPSALQRSNIDFNNANSMSLFLREQGNIIFLNDTTYKNGKPDIHGKTGIVIIPDKMSNEKKQLLKDFEEQLVDYDGLQIWYNFESHLECKMLFTKAKDQVPKIIDYFLSKYSKTK